MWLKCLNVSVGSVDECCDEAVHKSREQLSAAGLVLELEQTPGQEQTSLRIQASVDAEIKTLPRHFARANQADRCITLLHCAQRLTP